MTVSEMICNLATILAEHGDVEMMYNDINGEVRSIGYCNHRVAEQDEFPEEWSMPEGFAFVEICQ